MEEYFFIYKTTNLINQKIYIGAHQTKDIDDGYLGSGNLLKKAIKKYGKENFQREILMFCRNTEHMYQEEFKIVDKAFIDRKDTYNIKCGGLGSGGIGERNHFFGKKHSPQTIQKIKEANKLHPTRNFTEEHRNNMRKSRIGKKHSESTIEKIREAQKGKKHNRETKEKLSRINSNRKHTQESRDKISKANKGRIFSKDHRENIGNKSRISNSGRKKIYHPLTKQSKCVKLNEVDKYLTKGWKLGTGKSSHNKNKKDTLVKCPHCGKVGGKSAMYRWHFENCKNKVN